MKKTILLLLAAIGFFILPSSKVLAQATVGDVHIEYDASTFLQYCGLYACNGLGLQLEGTEYFDAHFVTNKNTVHTNTHITATFTATDANGNTYIGKENVTYSKSEPLVNGAFSFTTIRSIRFVSQGSAPNFTLKINSKTTRNADGTLTVDRFDTTTNCE